MTQDARTVPVDTTQRTTGAMAMMKALTDLRPHLSVRRPLAEVRSLATAFTGNTQYRQIAQDFVTVCATGRPSLASCPVVT